MPRLPSRKRGIFLSSLFPPKTLDIMVPKPYNGTMEQTTIRQYAGLLNDAILENAVMGDTKPQCATVNGEVVISEGTLKGLPEVTASIVVRANERSLLFSVQIASRRKGYQADLLNRFLTPEMVREYGIHAYRETLESNGFNPTA